MDIVRHLVKFQDVSLQQKSLLVDALSDLFESERISESTAIAIITAIIQLLETETDSEVVESVFNLLGWSFEKGFCKLLIINTTVKYLPTLDVGSLCHAFEILCESNLPNKKKLLTPYLASDDEFIRELARKQLLFC